MTTDTIKVCLTTTMTIDTMTYTCMQCDSLVFGPNGWVVMNMGNPTSITELTGGQMDGQMYDLLGREIFEITLGKMYIKNNKKCIRIK